MISKTAEYALRAMVTMACHPSRALAADFLAEETKVPRAYLHRVLKDLIKAELVQSRPGPAGGYELTRSNSKITVLDIINAVSPIERIRECPLGIPSHTKLCPLHHELDRAYAATEAAFRGVTLKSLVESTSALPPLCSSTRPKSKL